LRLISTALSQVILVIGSGIPGASIIIVTASIHAVVAMENDFQPILGGQGTFASAMAWEAAAALNFTSTGFAAELARKPFVAGIFRHAPSTSPRRSCWRRFPARSHKGW